MLFEFPRLLNMRRCAFLYTHVAKGHATFPTRFLLLVKPCSHDIYFDSSLFSDLSEFSSLYGLKSGWESSFFSTFAVTNKNEAQNLVQLGREALFPLHFGCLFRIKTSGKSFCCAIPEFLTRCSSFGIAFSDLLDLET